MVKIIYKNWPQLIEKNRIQEATSLAEDIDYESYERLRQAHVTTFIQTGKKEIFALIGGGYMSNGFSAEALRNADYWIETMKVREEVVIENIEQILCAIKLVNNTIYNNLVIHLIWFDSDDKLTLIKKQIV